MKSTFSRFLLIILAAILCSSCEDTNVMLVTGAATDAVKAITLTDEQVKNIAQRAAQDSDSKHRVTSTSNPYNIRLQNLVAKYPERDGHNFNYRVYLTKDINAFAMADGTIRVYSGLMDLMSDEELIFIIGHEMGHVVKKHSRKKVTLAYASSALRKGLASQNNEVGVIARSVLGAFTEQLTNAQFSQHEERQADQYGAAFLRAEGYNREAAVSALLKLADLAKQHTFLSSHPDPEARAKRILTDEPVPEQTSLIDTIMKYLKLLTVTLFNILQALLGLVFG